MRGIFAAPLVAALVILTGCATPQERCISDARAQLHAISADIRTAQGNIDRGYAIHYQDVPYTYISTCYDDDGAAYDCETNGIRTEETPVAIDVAEERRKLDRLQMLMPDIRRNADAAIAQCRVIHPE